jgi:cytochrome c553
LARDIGRRRTARRLGAATAFRLTAKTVRAHVGRASRHRGLLSREASSLVATVSRSLPPRAFCPGRDGGGVGSVFPVLAGRPGGYLSGKFGAWRDGGRFNDPLALMKVGFGAVLRGPAGRCRSALWPVIPPPRPTGCRRPCPCSPRPPGGRFPAFVSRLEIPQRLGMLMVPVLIVVGGALLVACSMERLCFPCLSHPRQLERGRCGGAARHPDLGPLCRSPADVAGRRCASTSGDRRTGTTGQRGLVLAGSPSLP